MKQSRQRRQGSGDEPVCSLSLSLLLSIFLSQEGYTFGISPLLSVLIENTQRISEEISCLLGYYNTLQGKMCSALWLQQLNPFLPALFRQAVLIWLVVFGAYEYETVFQNHNNMIKISRIMRMGKQNIHFLLFFYMQDFATGTTYLKYLYLSLPVGHVFK